MIEPQKDLIERAKHVLEGNWTGFYTKPSPRLYPHQWSWDSAFIAIGNTRVRPDRAYSELRHLLESRWANGLLPHIVFDSEAAHYFPGYSFWQSDRSPHAPKHRLTSGIVQPPIHATAVRTVYERAGDREVARSFVAEIFPHLEAWHHYLYGNRDPDGDGLVYITHPWESGMDNAPVWDDILMSIHLSPDSLSSYRRVDTDIVAASERPSRAEYDRYVYLVRQFIDCTYDENKIRRLCPFLVQDVLFNTLLCRAGKDMAVLAGALGADPEPFEKQAQRTADALNTKLWNAEHGLYLSYDLVGRRHLPAHMAACYAPLYAGIPTVGRAERMVKRLERFGFLGSNQVFYPVPSYDPDGFGFSPTRYWRGPVWININWILKKGLSQYGYDEHAASIRESILSLVKESGFYEYFDPLTGEGHGSDNFSWTAALLLDVLSEEM